MKVLVCGGRDYWDRHHLYWCLDRIDEDESITEVISGCSRGADTLAVEWANQSRIRVARFPANWDAHKKAAGPIRNQQMLDEGRPDLVVAFPGGTGTADMIDRARRAGVRVRVET